MHRLGYFIFFVVGITSFGFAQVNHPIDTNDPRQVAAEAFASLSKSQVAALGPQQTPIFEANKFTANADKTIFTLSEGGIVCPACSGDTITWRISQPNVVKCSSCNRTLPDGTYKDEVSETLQRFDGSSVTVNHYEDAAGNKFYIGAMVDSCKFLYLRDIMQDCAYTYTKTTNSTRFAQAIGYGLSAYADRLGQFVTGINGGGKIGYVSFDPDALHQGLISESWGLSCYPWETLHPYQTVYEDSVLDPMRTHIEQNYYHTLVEFALAQNEEVTVGFGNLGIETLRMAEIGKFFNWPECIHLCLRAAHRIPKTYAVGYDGMSIEGVGYHYLWLESVLNILRDISDWQDPVGYIDAKDGTYIGSPLRIDDIFPDTKRNASFAMGPLRILHPDGGDPGIHDSHAVKVMEEGLLSIPGSGRHSIETPIDEIYNQILPAFGQVALGDGYDDLKVQSQLHYSDYGNHAHRDTMMFDFYAFNRVLFGYPGHQGGDTMNKNTVVVDHRRQNVYYGHNLRGYLDLYAPTLPGLSVVRVNKDDIQYEQSKEMKRYRRTLVQNTVSLERPYVIDIFEVEGGSLHEYLLAGSLHYAQTATASINLSSMSDSTPLHQSGDDDMWLRHFDMKSASLQACSVDMRFDDLTAQGVRSHITEMGAGELIVGWQKDYETYDSNNTITARPELVIRRGTNDPNVDDLRSEFVLVHEAFEGGTFINQVERHDLGDGCLALVIEMDDRTDTYLISLGGPKPMAWGNLSAEATIAAFSQAKSSNKEDLWIVGGTRATTEQRALVADEGVQVGSLLEVTRLADGAMHDSLVVDLPFPLGRSLHGQVVLVEFFDSTDKLMQTQAYTIEEVIAGAGDERVVVIKDEPGVRLNADLSVDEIYWPFRHGTRCQVRFINSLSSVPSIVDFSPARDWTIPQPVQVMKGVSFEDTISPSLVTVPENAPVRYTVDGTRPTTNSPPYTSGLRFAGETTLQVQPLNSGGITVPRLRKERFFPKRRGLTGTPGAPGVNYELYYETPTHTAPYPLGVTGVWTNLTPQQVEPSFARHMGVWADGLLAIPQDGLYQFYFNVDTDIDFYIGDEQVVLQHGLRSTRCWKGALYLTAGYHPFKLDYHLQTADVPTFSFEWSGPGFSRQPIPDSTFFTTLDASGHAYTVTYRSGGGGALSGLTNQVVSAGANGVGVTAQPHAGYQFVGWSDGLQQEARQELVVTNDLAFTALFAPETQSLSYASDPDGTLAGLPSQGVPVGETGSPVTAVPNAGYSFAQWSDGVMTATRTDIAGTHHLQVTAHYTKNPVLIVADQSSIVVGEGMLATLQVKLSTAPESNIVVNAAAGAGLQLKSGTTLTFTGLNWDVFQPIVVEGELDADTQDDTSSLILSGVGVQMATTPVDLIDAGVQVSLSDAEVNEGDSGGVQLAFAIALSQPSHEVVSLRCQTVDGSARVSDGDYVALNQLVDIPAGSTNAVVNVTVQGDSRLEAPVETLALQVERVSGRASLATIYAEGQILDDDDLSSLLLHWPFDEVSGTQVADASGNSRDGLIQTAQSDMWVPAGKVGGALNTKDVGGIDMQGVWSGIISNEISVSFWNYMDYGTYNELFKFTDASDNTVLFSWFPWDNGSYVLWGTVSIGPMSFTYERATMDGQWRHIVFTKNKGDLTIDAYVDGVHVGGQTNNNRWISSVEHFFINGKDRILDDFRIYDEELSQPDIDALFAMGDSPQLRLEVDQAQVTLNEGDSSTLAFTLSFPPQNPVTVNFSVSGATDFSVEVPSIMFTPDNWDQPQSVVVRKLNDSDTQHDMAMLNCVAVGLPDVHVALEEIDQGAQEGVTTSGFTAFNDFAVAAGEPTHHITHLSSLATAPHTGVASGYLVDYATGQPTPVYFSMTTAGNGGSTTADIVAVSPSTDAGQAFRDDAGQLACGTQGFIDNTTQIRLDFQGLDARNTYELVLFGNRNGGPSYDGRITQFTLLGADQFVNASSVGRAGALTTVTNGNNTAGYIARYTDIATSNGLLSVTCDAIDKTYLSCFKLVASGVTNRVFRPDVDTDGDGMSDFLEDAFGTNWQLPDPWVPCRRTATGIDYVVRNLKSGYTYQLQTTTDLNGTWTNQGAAISGQDNGPITTIPLPFGSEDRLFIRLQVSD